jgi:hypothetical protein
VKIAFWLTSLGQVALLASQYPVEGQVLAGALLVAVMVALLWQVRAVLPIHTDMFLIMTAFGGFGMVSFGYGQPSCHHSYAGTVGMLVASLPPSLLAARCLQGPGRYWYLLLDTVGMLIGMEVGHRIAIGADPWLMHAAMLVGMNLGMTLRLGVRLLTSRGRDTSASGAARPLSA